MKIGENVTQNKNNNDIANAIAIYRDHRVLQIGYSKSISIEKYVNNEIICVSDIEGISTEFIKNRAFDRIFVLDTSINEIRRCIRQLSDMNVGLICVLLNNEEGLEELKDYVEAYWYPAEVWTLKLDVGTLLLTNAFRAPRFFNLDSLNVGEEIEL